jgi:hypothetical protein
LTSPGCRRLEKADRLKWRDHPVGHGCHRTTAFVFGQHFPGKLHRAPVIACSQVDRLTGRLVKLAAYFCTSGADDWSPAGN